MMKSNRQTFRAQEESCRELVFLWWDDGDDRGVFITCFHLDFMTRFYAAIENCETFGEFWKALEETDKEYIGAFLEAEESRPADDQLIADLQESVWVFCESEFPITQCAEQTYTLLSNKLPTLFLAGEITTEYGEKIGLFNKSDFVEMKEAITRHGYSVEPLLSPFGKYIFDYGV